LIQTLCAQGRLAQAAALLQGLPAPTQRTYESLLLAAARAEDASLAAAVHRRLEADRMFRSDPFLSTRLIDAYAALSALPAARQVFDEAPEKNIFLWNAMLKALALADYGEEALARLADMGRLGVPVDSYSYAHGLKACIGGSASHAPASARVQEMHAHAIRRRLWIAHSCRHHSYRLLCKAWDCQIRRACVCLDAQEEYCVMECLDWMLRQE
jgi:hypothetical protein